MSPGITLTQDLGHERNGKETPLASLKSRSTAAVKGRCKGRGEGPDARMVAKGLALDVGHSLPAVRCS